MNTIASRVDCSAERLTRRSKGNKHGVNLWLHRVPHCQECSLSRWSTASITDPKLDLARSETAQPKLQEMVTIILLAPGSPLSQQADLRAAVFNVDGPVPLILAPFVTAVVIFDL